MSEELNRYIFLDDEQDRKQFLAKIHDVRQDVISLIGQVPQEKWYEARYHGWSIAAMISHLNLADNYSMLMIKLALLGIRPAPSMGLIDQINGLTASLFRKRVVQTSAKSVRANEKLIAEFVLKLPVSKFSTQVYEISLGKFITIEQCVQERFYYHWQEHLATMQAVEGIQPTERRDSAG